MSLAGKHVLFFANVDWSFLSHRKEIAAGCIEAGAEVTLMAGDTGRLHEIEALGVRAVPVDLSRTGTDAKKELRTVSGIASSLRSLRPDIQHNVSIKPVLYGTICAQQARPELLVNAVSGAGSIFDRQGAIGLARDLGCLGLTPLMNRKGVYWVFQNEDDIAVYRKRHLVRGDQLTLTMGSGVDLDRFQPRPLPDTPTAVFASRLIWSKGVGTFVEAAELVRQEFPRARFILAGDPVDANSGSIGRQQLDDWVDSGVVEWAGVVDDMPALLGSATALVLPSWYREGVPKVMLEAAACGRPTIGGDIPGARRAIDDPTTGFLVNPRSAREVADALIKLFESPSLVEQMSTAARVKAEASFGVDAVVKSTLDLYSRGLTSSTRHLALA